MNIIHDEKLTENLDEKKGLYIINTVKIQLVFQSGKMGGLWGAIMLTGVRLSNTNSRSLQKSVLYQFIMTHAKCLNFHVETTTI